MHLSSIGTALPTASGPWVADRTVPCDGGEAAGEPGSPVRRPLRRRLLQALADRRFQVHYQPVVAAGSRRPIMVEALARLPRGAGSWVPPHVFVPLAEQHGYVDELFNQVAGAALRQFRHWRLEGRDLRLALNVSRLQLRDPRFPRRIARLVRQSGLEAEWIVLEITESQPVHAPSGDRLSLRELAQYGFRLALDDFGAGHARHARLGDCAWDIVKTDHRLIRALARTGRVPATLARLLQLARELGVATVVEGIEDAGLAALAESLGVSALQGFHLGMPRPGAECFDPWEPGQLVPRRPGDCR